MVVVFLAFPLTAIYGDGASFNFSSVELEKIDVELATLAFQGFTK